MTKTNNLSSSHPEIALEVHPSRNVEGINADTISSGSNKKIWWMCQKDHSHEWEAVVKSRTRIIKGRTSTPGCPFCSNKVVSPTNCLAYKYPEIAKEWHPTKNGEFTPINVMQGGHHKFWWICSGCGVEFQQEIASRKRGLGCNGVCSNRKKSISQRKRWSDAK